MAAKKLTFELTKVRVRLSLTLTLTVSPTLALTLILTLTLTKGATLPTMVMGDRHRLQQILSHLLENGLQFTKRGRVAMSAVTIDQDDTTFYVRISVEDTGIGIKPENKARQLSPSPSPYPYPYP